MAKKPRRKKQKPWLPDPSRIVAVKTINVPPVGRVTILRSNILDPYEQTPQEATHKRRAAKKRRK